MRTHLQITRATYFDVAALAETRAHRSDGQLKRIHLRHLLYPATTCSTPMQDTRIWGSSLLLTYG